MATLQIQQEVPGGKKSEDEGMVSKRKGKIFRSRKAERQGLRQEGLSVATTAKFKGRLSLMEDLVLKDQVSRIKAGF